MFDFKVGPGLKVHNSNIDLDDPPSKPKVPSIGVFFDDAGSYFADVRIHFRDHHKNFKSEFIGFSYSYEKKTTNNRENEILLGNKLSINSYNMYLGLGHKIQHQKQVSFFYGYLGYAIKKYEGKSNFAGYHAKYNFKNESALRFALGYDYYLSSKNNFFINVQIMYDIGTVERDEIDIYDGGDCIGKMDPTGDLILPDNIFSLQFNFGYSKDIK